MSQAVLPALFVSHNAPTLIERSDGAAAFLRGLGRSLPRPRAIVCVTAHWETEVPTIGACAAPSTMHDFSGFAPHFYELRYPAPGAVAVAADIVAALRAAGIEHAVDHQRGLDHATWVPLMLMYPEASIPVTQLSVQPAAGIGHHLAVGRALARLRASGVLILGSGASVHNLEHYPPSPSETPEWASSFQAWLGDAVARGDTIELAEYRRTRADAEIAHPRDEHLMPLFVAMGAGGGGRVLYEGLEGGLGQAAYAFDGADAASEMPPRRSRLRRDERERLIVEEAIRFFVENGVEGQTRALAERLGITQPLLYRYFPDKEALVERVFQEIFARRWQSEWRTIITDRARPLPERLVDFATSYALALSQDGWWRLVLSSGLKGGSFDARVLEAIRDQIVMPLATELQHEFGTGSAADPDQRLVELAWALHAGLSFAAQRTWVHNIAAPRDGAASMLVEAMLSGARAVMNGARAEQAAE